MGFSPPNRKVVVLVGGNVVEEVSPHPKMPRSIIMTSFPIPSAINNIFERELMSFLRKSDRVPLFLDQLIIGNFEKNSLNRVIKKEIELLHSFISTRGNF